MFERIFTVGWNGVDIHRPYIENNEVCRTRDSGHGYPMKIIEIHFHFERIDTYIYIYIRCSEMVHKVLM